MMRLSGRRRVLLLRSLYLAFALALLPSLFLLFPHPHHAAPSWSSSTAIHEFPPISTSYGSNELKPRRRFESYQEYLQLQLNKTLNAKLRQVWTTTDWRRKVDVFSPIFQFALDRGLLRPEHKVMCIGARVGQEVLALKEIGVSDAIGIDIVPAPPLVIEGDIHRHPFRGNTFDFEFSNVFDHAVFPQLFVSEIERTLKPHGVAVLHVALHTRSDKFSANDLLSVDGLLALFKNSDVVHVRQVDALGLDTEVAMRKRMKASNSFDAPSYGVFQGLQTNCSKSRLKPAFIEQAEPLILTEPKKPWITLKKNMKRVKYLPTITNISNYRRHIYVDIGARNYGSSIASWFKKQYPKHGHNFTIFAIEADIVFESSYANHSDVNFMPYAAWIRNESLMFGSVTRNRRSAGHVGMGRIQHLHGAQGSMTSRNTEESVPSQLTEVQGLDIAEWIKSIAGEDDFLLMKMDVEGAEYDLLPRLFDTGVICLVDELFLECHYNRWQSCCPERSTKFNRTYQDCLTLFQSLRHSGVLVHQWW